MRANYSFFSVRAVINGEKAVFNIPVFAQKREKTLDMLIRRAVETHLSEAPRPPLVSRKSTGEILAESEPPAVFARNKEEQRRIEFAKFGQVCRVDYSANIIDKHEELMLTKNRYPTVLVSLTFQFLFFLIGLVRE